MATGGGTRGTARAPVGWWRQVRTLVRRELRQISRDRVALSIAVIAPVAAAMLASVALGAPRQVDATIAIVTPPGTSDAAARAIAAFDSGDFGLRVVATESEARDLVRSGDISAAVVVPVSGDEPMRVIANRSEQIPEAIAYDLARLAQVPGAAGAIGPDSSPAAAVITQPVDRTLGGAELYGHVVAVFFLFLTTGLVARSLHRERTRGTLTRMRVMAVGSDAILASKGIVMVLLGGLEMAAVLLALSAVFGANWGSVVATVVVGVAITLAVGAIALVVATLTRSLELAQVLELLIALTFAALGGNLVPLANLPDAARFIAGLTPNGVAIRAFREVAVGGTLIDVWRSVAVIGGLAFALGWFAFTRARRIVAQ